MKKFLYIFLSVIIISGLFISSCTTESETATTVTTTVEKTVEPGRTEILVGAINSMTGGEAMVGAEHRWAYQQAIYDINEAGGIYVAELGRSLPMRLILADDQSDVSKAAAAAEKLINLEKVDFVLGTVSTPQNISGAAVAEKYKKLYVTTTFFTEFFAENEFQWVVDSFFSSRLKCWL